jgi:hypothetical protein
VLGYLPKDLEHVLDRYRVEKCPGDRHALALSPSRATALLSRYLQGRLHQRPAACLAEPDG